MFCKNCGFDVGQYKFCTNCGAEVVAEPMQNAAPQQTNYGATAQNTYAPHPGYGATAQNTYAPDPGYGATAQNTYAPDPGYGATAQNTYAPDPGYGAAPYAPVQDFNLITAYKSFWKKYADFKGRSRRKEYWLAMVANGIIMFVLTFVILGILLAIGVSLNANKEPSFGFALITILLIAITALYSLAIIIPTISMTVRRLHDSGYSGWFCLLCFAFNIVNIVFMCLDSKPGANQYGPNPKGR